jgi:hypothetical protein
MTSGPLSSFVRNVLMDWCCNLTKSMFICKFHCGTTLTLWYR